MHPFFQEIKASPGLHAICRTDLLQLPQPYTGIRYPFYSDSIERQVFALYRHPRYLLQQWGEYCDFLKKEIDVEHTGLEPVASTMRT